ncbi:unnamed protein product [Mytilus coruscus]|uniref:DDE Tnp4 domain-containing protein n=1 Tax=Mytilus coruscus TaxID=42192 RepID=A0A6J8C6Q5_MYTCO|nr:unnamed protein product [Mytilus coruscus]
MKPLNYSVRLWVNTKHSYLELFLGADLNSSSDEGVNDYEHISQRFDDMGTRNFPGILGAIDGSHIQIEAPLHNPKSYFNRKQFQSVVNQGVCKEDFKLIDINVGLYENGFQKCGNGRYYLLGDAAYPLKEWLLTPYRDNGHLSQQQTRFNVAGNHCMLHFAQLMHNIQMIY